jgi:hypothetical protein
MGNRVYGISLNKKAVGTGKIFKNQELWIEGDLLNVFGPIPGYGKPDLPYLACFKGNPAAINAMEREGYKFDDGPFYYCKMGALGYIISEKDFQLVDCPTDAKPKVHG